MDKEEMIKNLSTNNNKMLEHLTEHQLRNIYNIIWEMGSTNLLLKINTD